MNTERIKKFSKKLSFVLRHNPESIGITLSKEGWVKVSILLDALNKKSNSYTVAMIEEIVANNDKKRFEFSEDGSKIRARQGHSVKVDLGYESEVPPEILYHGTATSNLDSIFESGLVKRNRHHVHMSTDEKTMISVGRRHGTPIVLKIDAAKMHQDGHKFYVTGNNVWLTDHVPVQYISVSE